MKHDALDYNQQVDGDDLEARVVKDFNIANKKGLFLIALNYESACADIWEGTPQELKALAKEMLSMEK